MKLGSTVGNLLESVPILCAPTKRLRALLRSRRARPHSNEVTYSDWVRTVDTPSADDILRHRTLAASFHHRPTISVLMPVFDPDPAVLEAAIRSVCDQSYPHWELCIADDASLNPAVIAVLKEHLQKDSRVKVRFRDMRGSISAASNSALELATGEFIALLDHDDLLPPLALHRFVEAINRHPSAKVLYSDEDKVDASGRRFDPHFKGDFNHVLLLAQNMISHLGVYRRDLVMSVGGFRVGLEGAQDYDLALRCAASVSRHDIVHIPGILYHWRAISGSTAESANAKSYATIAAQRAVTEHLRLLDSDAIVEAAPDAPAYQRVRFSLPSPAPLVSIVICTRDQGGLLRSAVDSIRSQTTYPRYEIVILDNGSRDPSTLAVLHSMAALGNATLIRDDAPFNYSRLNNIAVNHSRGQVVCLLNDDIEVLTPGWLEEMVSFAVQHDVGAVGARLWYPDGTLQHGGVMIGPGGVAGHSHHRLPRGKSGYFGRAVLQQEVSAVTGACLAVRREVFDSVGGLDERLAVAFNDVDLCLRIRSAGYRNIWTPFAELVHYESRSRGYEDTPDKQARFRGEVHFMKERWGASLRLDPYYNPHLSITRGDFSLELPGLPLHEGTVP